MSGKKFREDSSGGVVGTVSKRLFREVFASSCVRQEGENEFFLACLGMSVRQYALPGFVCRGGAPAPPHRSHAVTHVLASLEKLCSFPPEPKSGLYTVGRYMRPLNCDYLPDPVWEEATKRRLS